jgi:hypothetical protein
MKPYPVVVATGFKDQNPLSGILRQPVGEDAATRAGADHDIVEIPLEPLHNSLTSNAFSCP